MHNLRKLGIVGAFSMLPGMVFAQATALDTTAAVAQLAEIETGVTAVGGALLVAAAVAVGFKWLKGAIFG